MSLLLKSPYENEYSKVEPFFHTDTEQLYHKNVRKIGATWPWLGKPIEYRFNSHGYRMEKELAEVNTSNYYAFFGCSFAVGTGIPLKETYAYLIAKQASVDYINGAIGGGSVDFVLYNISQLFSSDATKPKAIVINWPELTRTTFWVNDTLQPYLVNAISDKFWEPAYNQFLREESHINNRFTMIRKTVTALCKAYKTKLYELTTYQSDENFHKKHPGINVVNISPPNMGEDPITDPVLLGRVYARDIHDIEKQQYGHPGLFFQEEVTKSFFRWLNHG